MQKKLERTMGYRSTIVRVFLPIFIIALLASSAGTSVIYSFNFSNSNNTSTEVNDTPVNAIENKNDLKTNGPQPEKSEITLVYTYPNPVVFPGIFDRIDMEGLLKLINPGEPALPFDTAKVLIPPDSIVDDIRVTAGEKTYLLGVYKIEPAGEPVPLSEFSEEMLNPELLVPDEDIYSSDELYPGELYEQIGVERFRGYDIAVINLFPVQYIPNQGIVYYYDSLTVSIDVKPITTTRSAAEHYAVSTYRGLPSDQSAVSAIIDNPSDVSLYNLFEASSGTRGKTNASAIYDMVIITNDTLNSSTGVNFTFQDLADYRNTHGIKTTIFTIENITSNPKYWNTSSTRFNDTAAQIRNFIIDAYKTWGLTYVLLGGDGDGADVGGESAPAVLWLQAITTYLLICTTPPWTATGTMTAMPSGASIQPNAIGMLKST
jgi:hypothetical protein